MLYGHKVTHNDDPYLSYISYFFLFSDNGGIYLDTDVLVLKSLATLRRHPTTMVPSLANTISNGFIITRQNSPYLCLLQHNYFDYQPESFRLNSVLATKKLYDLYPWMVHLGKTEAFFNPSWTNRTQLITDHVDWSNNYLMHIWTRGIGADIPINPKQIRHMNNTLGDIMRYVYYGSRDLLT